MKESNISEMQEIQSTIDLPLGHPIQSYLQETVLLQKILDELEQCDVEEEYQLYYNLFNKLNGIERRFQRKENQLFPFLEKIGWNGPSQNMWSFHDTIRDVFKFIRQKLEAKDYRGVRENFPFLSNNIHRLLLVEETVLFPNALKLLNEEDWCLIRKGENEIGWMMENEPAAFPVLAHPNPAQKQNQEFEKENWHHFDEGYMTVEQVNLLLRTMPLDITYVDENDKVIFYNRGDERTFPRSAGIIGREVKFCHPPKSVDTVIKILEAFRKGTHNEASFWINYKERLIYIRYFAVRDDKKIYRGVIEMSQDITSIKSISGERRLLEWEEK